jgi:zinc protease
VSPFQAPVQWSAEHSLHLRASHRNQSHILVLFSLPGLGDPSNVTSALLKRILAGQGGILFQELRDRQGLGYAVAPMLWHSPLAGFLGFYIGTDPDRANEALQSFQDIVAALADSPVSPADLERAQNLLQAEYYRDRQSLLSRSSEASDLHIYGLPLDYQEKMIAEAWRAGTEDIRALAGRYLDWDRAYHIMLSPE